MPSLVLTNKTLSTLFHKKCVGELFTRTMAVATIKQVSNTPHLNLWLRKSSQMKTYHLTLFKKTTTFSFLGRLLLNHDLLFNRKDKNILYVLPGYCMFFYVFCIFCVKKSVELFAYLQEVLTKPCTNRQCPTLEFMINTIIQYKWIA